MKQSKKLSAYEAATNVVVGLVVSILAQMALYPLMGIKVSFSQNLVITAVFFVLSFARGYIIRRLFNKICVHERKRWWWTDGKKWYLTQKHKNTYLVLRCNNCGKILKEKDEYN